MSPGVHTFFDWSEKKTNFSEKGGPARPGAFLSLLTRTGASTYSRDRDNFARGSIVPKFF